MSKLSDALRERKVFNDYEFFGNQPYVIYRPQKNWSSSGWIIFKRGESLGDRYSDGGGFFILVWGRRDKAEKFEVAKKYMRDQFGITELAKAPTGGWGDAEFVKRRIKEILG